MFEVRTSSDTDASRWDSGKPIGWVVTVDGDWPFFSLEERDDLVVAVRAEELRLGQ